MMLTSSPPTTDFGGGGGGNVNPYLKGQLDTLDVLKAKLDPVGFEGYCIGMVHKRLHRAASLSPGDFIGKQRDWNVAAWYLDQLSRYVRTSGLGQLQQQQQTIDHKPARITDGYNHATTPSSQQTNPLSTSTTTLAQRLL